MKATALRDVSREWGLTGKSDKERWQKMGERSWGRFTVAARDEERAQELVEPETIERGPSGGGTVSELDVDDRNGGGSATATELQHAGIPFEWIWDACPGAYENGRQVFVPGKDGGVAEAHADGVYALVSRDGEVDKASLAAAREFLRLVGLFEKYVAE